MWSFSMRTTERSGDGVSSSISHMDDGMTSTNERRKVNVEKDEFLGSKGSSLSHVVEDCAMEHNEEEDWRNLRQAGFLDQTKLRNKEKSALMERIQELERELYRYQYHMGLLLIENEGWDSRFQKLQQEFLETTESQKRMQTTHAIVVSQLQDQEENMRKSLSFQKQKIINLEKELNESLTESREIKLAHQKKLADMHALEAEIEEKNLEVKAKLHSLNANLAETSRKSSEIDIRFDDVQVQERKLRKEASFFIVKKKQFEEDMVHQREDLHAWEQKLQEHWKILLEGQSAMSEKDTRVNERDMILTKKEEELNENFLYKQEILSAKERQLLATEEPLNKETALVQMTFDAHNPIYEVQRKDRETGAKKSTIINDILKDKIDDVATNDAIFDNRENTNFGTKNDLERKVEYLKDKRNGNEEILNASKESCMLHAKDMGKKIKGFDKERELLDERTSMIETTLTQLSYDKEKFDIWKLAEAERLQKMKLEMAHITKQFDDHNHQEKVEGKLKDKLNDFCSESMVDLNDHNILELEKRQKNVTYKSEIGKDIDMPTSTSNYLSDIFDHGDDVEPSQTKKDASSFGNQRIQITVPYQLVELERSYKENSQEIDLNETHSFINDQLTCNSSLKRRFSPISRTMEIDDMEDYEASESLSEDYKASESLSEDYEASESLSEDYEISESLSSIQYEEGTQNFSSEIEVPGLRRYNFRHSTIVRAVAVAESLADRIKRKKIEKLNQLHENAILNTSVDGTNETQNNMPSHEFTLMTMEPLNNLIGSHVKSSRDLSPNNMQEISSEGVKESNQICENLIGPLENQEKVDEVNNINN